MPDKFKQKIRNPEELINILRGLRKEGKSIVQSHGVFDLIHPGVIRHLSSAKEQGDILVVTVIQDEDVRRGPGRPIFPENLRLENAACLDPVDYVCLVDDKKPFSATQLINPDILAKGQEKWERDKQIHQKTFEEEKKLHLGKCRIFETDGFSLGSSQIFKDFFSLYPEQTRSFLKKFAATHTFNSILDSFNTLESLNVLIIGDGIIDEYHYCEPMGKAGKANLIVHKYMDHEVFAGGAFAIANHTAGICKNVHLISLLGHDDSREGFLEDHLKPNISTRFFERHDAPTIVKKRYVHPYSNQKLFEINFINDVFVSADLEAQITEYLEGILDQYDLVMISDFGHGFISDKIYSLVKKVSKMLAVNTQTNGANTGYNLITKYRKPNYVCLDETEVRLAAQEKFKSVSEIAPRIRESIDADHLIVTMGKNGSFGVNKSGEVNQTPIFSTKVIDTIGAGDAYFAFTAPAFAREMPLDLVSFIGNAVGALAVQSIGNKKPIERYELLEFINSLLK